jgi:hypothetical protein
MCCTNGRGNGGGGSNGWAWSRAITSIVVGLLFAVVVYGAARNETSNVLMTPSNGCMTATGNGDVLLAKYGKNSECAFDGSVFWVDEELEEFSVFYQEDDGDLMCMTDPCGGAARPTCPKPIANKVTFELCHHSRVEQLWTRRVGTSKLVSVVADRHPTDKQCCLTAATKAYGGQVINDGGYLWTEDCDIAVTDPASTAKHGLEQDWKFFDDEPTLAVPAADVAAAEAKAAVAAAMAAAGSYASASATASASSSFKGSLDIGAGKFVKIGTVTGKPLA